MKQGLVYIESNFEKTSLTQGGEVFFFSEAKIIYSEISAELFALCGVSRFYKDHEKKCVDTIAYILKAMVKTILPHPEHLVGRLAFQMFVLRDANWLSQQGLAVEFGKILKLMKEHGYIDDEVDGFNNKRKPSESTKGYILFLYANIEKMVDAARFLFKEKRQKPIVDNPYVDIRERGMSISRKKDKNGKIKLTEFETWVSGDLTKYKNKKELKRIIRQTRKIEDFIKKPTYSIPVRDNFSNDEERIDYVLSYNYNEIIKYNINIHLCRVFHKDLQHSGRYYGKQHCYMPKEYRNKILIDGQNTIQLDFKSCVPSILYVMSGNKLEKNQDLYHVDSLDIPREYLKYIFVCALNSPSESLAYKAIRNEYWENPEIFPDFSKEYISKVPTNEDIQGWLNKILEQYPYLKNYFFTPDEALIAINKESAIITEVYSRCIQESIPIVDVYDCILCQECHKERVYSIMKESCLSILEQELNIDIE